MAVTTKQASPTAPGQRIVALDVLRGFALLGILVMNIQLFAMPVGFITFNPLAYGDLSGINLAVWSLSHIFADQKFMTIFSPMFGAGILLLTDRLEARGQSARGIHYRRNVWLLLFGLAHGFLLWTGDILVTYAVAGFVVFLLRHMRPGRLVIVGLVFLLVPAVLTLLGSLSPDEAVATIRSDWSPGASRVNEQLAAYRGGWLEQMSARVPAEIEGLTSLLPVWAFWRAGGLMLIGMAAYKWGILTAQRSGRFYAWMALIGLVIGLPLATLSAWTNYANEFAPTYSLFGVGYQLNYWGSIFVSSGYIGLVMLATQRGWFGRIEHRLAAVGRTALTNYLLHTIICTTIFYGHGLGLYGSVERWQQVLIVVGIWVVQLAVAPLWLARFQYGPCEWLWRALTYAPGLRMLAWRG